MKLQKKENFGIHKFNCSHNSRILFTSSFYCEDCKKFIKNDTFEYLYFEGLEELYWVFHNLHCGYFNSNKKTPLDIIKHRDKLNDLNFNNKKSLYSKESLLYYFKECENVLKKYNKNKDSASLALHF